MRGAAAILIVIRHWRVLAFEPLYFPNSHLAVDLFFMLSGFVIPFAYEQRLASGLSPAGFLCRRIVRLYPLYLLGTLPGLIFFAGRVLLHSSPGDWTLERLGVSLAADLVMAPWPGPLNEGGVVYPLMPVAWSLMFELIVNAGYVLVWRRLRGAWSFGLTLGLLAAALIASGLFYGKLDIGPTSNNVWGGLWRSGFGFTAGLALYRLWRAGRLPRIPAPPLFLVGLAVAAQAVALPGALNVPYQLAVVLLLWPAVIAAAVQNEPGPWLRKPFLFLGGVSYALYALHYQGTPYLNWLGAKVLHIDLRALSPFSGLVALAVLLAVAWIVDRVYDAPARRWLLTWPERRAA